MRVFDLLWCNLRAERQTQGSVPEWLNGPHSKCGIPERVSGVRILPLPHGSEHINILICGEDEKRAAICRKHAASRAADCEICERRRTNTCSRILPLPHGRIRQLLVN